ncbi:MAG TPA: hypothetical protein DEP35_25095 [Deltaproteobacteria bacterium]|nr:hypothetical protein [Deltaproteobacteria bacterium]
MSTPRPAPARLSEARVLKLDPRLRAFAEHLGKAVAESILRDIRAGRCGMIGRKPAEGRGGANR